MKLSLAAIAQMCNGELSLGSNAELIINNVVIDSRKVMPNTLFVAIKGEVNDGHDFIRDLDLTNCAVIANSNSCIKLPNVIYVVNTILALGLLAHNYRMLFHIPVIAITGSNGKTTVKEMLKSICYKEYSEECVLATAGNLNNHLGMPLTLLQLNEKHKVAIIEMGMNHSGELKYLSNIAKPSIALINNVMFAHAGHFNSLIDIAQAKGEIYSGLIDGGVMCINVCSQFASMWCESVADKNLKIIKYGCKDSSCYISDYLDNNTIQLETITGEKIIIKLQILGAHNYDNALSACVLALQLNCKLDNIKSGLEDYKGYSGRLEQKIAFNGATLIDDCYNANPDSVKAAINAIVNLPHPHWMIFADLKELGKWSIDAHKEIGEYAFEHGIDKLLTIGDYAQISNENFRGEKLHFTSNQDIVEYCIRELPKTATLLIKGSNKIG